MCTFACAINSNVVASYFITLSDQNLVQKYPLCLKKRKENKNRIKHCPRVLPKKKRQLKGQRRMQKIDRNKIIMTSDTLLLLVSET